MVINGLSLLRAAPIKDMLSAKITEHGVSHGLAEVGYDIRLKQEVIFHRGAIPWISVCEPEYLFAPEIYAETTDGSFCLASAIEEFQMPTDLVAIVHDKSTWARKGLSVFNTVIEPGWNGFLTLELVYHGNERLHIPAGAGIAQVVFHRLSDHGQYQGKYQNQEDRPVSSIMEV